MNRQQHLDLADTAAIKATELARTAEDHAHSSDSHYRQRTAELAAAGALWADIAHAHTAIAALLPDTAPPA